VPVGFNGTLNAIVKAKVNGTSDIHTSGNVGVRQLTLWGGPLGMDNPEMDSVDVEFDVALDGNQLAVTKLDLRSPIAEAQVSGTMPKPKPGSIPEGKLKANASVDLPALAKSFPSTLRLHKDLTIESGQATLNTEVSSDPKGAIIDADVRIADILAMRGGKAVAPEGPIRMTLKGRVARNEEGFEVTASEVDSAKLDSSFATAQGSGTLENFNLSVKSDLAAATREVGKLVDLGGRSLSGQAILTVEVKPDEGSPARRRILANAELKDYEAKGFVEDQSISGQSMTAVLNTLAEFDAKRMPKRLTDTTLTLRSHLVDSDVTIARLAGKPTAAEMEVSGLKAETRAKLGDLVALLHSLKKAPENLEVAGEATVICEAGLAGGKLRLSKVDAGLADFVFTQKQGDVKKVLREPGLRLTAVAQADLTQRSASLGEAKLVLSCGEVRTKAVEVPDWSRAPAGVVGDLVADFDIEKALTAFGDFVVLKEGTRVAGKARVTAKVQALEASQKFDAVIVADTLKVETPKTPAFEEKRVEVSANGLIEPGRQSLQFDRLQVKSDAVGVEAKGTLTDWTQSRRLKADGTLEVNFDRVGPLVAALSGQEISLSGQDKKPFSVDAQLGGKNWREVLKQTTASAGLYVEKAEYMGMDFSKLDVSLNTNKPGATANIAGTANEGQLSVTPELDLTTEPPVLRLPENAKVLVEARVTDEMANQALARILPIFHGAAKTTGTVDVEVRQFRFPLEENAVRKLFTDGAIEFHDVSFLPGEWLAKLLSYVELENQPIEVPDQKLNVKMENGEIQQSMKLSVADYTLTVSGALSLDKTATFVVELPVTRELIRDEKLYELLKNITPKAKVTRKDGKFEISPKDVVLGNLSDKKREELTEDLEKRIREEGGKLIQKGLEELFK